MWCSTSITAHPPGALADGAAQLVHLVVRETGGRLVEQQQVGLGDEGAGERHPLLHRVGQGPGVALGEAAGAEVLEGGHGAVAQRTLVLVAPGQAEQGGQEAGLGP
jgi:hypothetical protein